MDWWVQFTEALSRIGILIGGTFGLYLAWRRVSAANQQAEAQTRQAEAATRQTELGRHKLVAELFQQAVGQLGDEKLEVRLFAIYSLRRISEDHPDYKRAIFELLTAFVRTNSNKWGDSVPPLDVLEIFKILELNLASDS